MATASDKIEFIPDEPIDFVPDEAPANGGIEFIPDEVAPEVVQQEAQRNTLGAVQALDVMAAPQSFDWTEVNEQADRERFQAAEQAGARALQAEEQGSGTGPGSEAFAWRRERDFQLGQISPNTSIGRMLAQQGQQELQQIEDVGTTAERERTPSQLLSGFMGPGLSATAQPVVESAARNLGPAAGGTLGASMFLVPGGGIARMLLPLAGGFGGAQVGGAVQEEVLKTTETPEETEARRRAAAEDFARNPWATRISAAAAQSPFFGPSLAQFGRAIYGDRGAMTNLGIAGLIGGGMEVANAALQRRTADAEDIAAGIFSNMIMNEPTKLGRRLGFHPSSEQAAVEAAQKYAELPPEGPTPIGSDLQSGLTTHGMSSTADVFSRVQRQTGEPNAQQISETGTPDGGVRPPEIAPEDVPLPAPEGGEGIQPSRQGEPLVEGTPEAPRALRETALKNARVDEERAARGLHPMDEVVPIADRDLWEKAKQTAAEDPFAASRLIKDLKETPRPTDSDETMLLLYERMRLSNELNNAADELNAARESGDESAVLEANRRLNFAEDAIGDLEQAAGKRGAGSEAGRAFRLRQLFAQEDYTLATMTSRMKASQDGVNVSPEKAAQQMEEVRTLSSTIGETQKEMDALRSQAETKAQEIETGKQVDEVIKDTLAEKETDAPEARSLADRILEKLEARSVRAREGLRTELAKLTKLGAVADPKEQGRAQAMVLRHLTDLAVTAIARKGVKASKWIADTISEFGEKVRPLLQKAWDDANVQIDKLADSATSDTTKRASVVRKIRSVAEKRASIEAEIAEKIAQGADVRSLGSSVSKLSNTLVRAGTKTSKDLISSVKDVLSQYDPTITERDAAKLIAEKRKQVSRPDPFNKELQSIRKELRSLEEDASRREEAKIKRVNAAIERGKAELSGERKLRGRSQSADSQALAEAKAALSEVQAQIKTKRAEQSMARAEEAVENSIKKLDEEIRTGKLEVVRKTSKEASQRLEDLRMERDALQRLKSQLRRESLPKVDPKEAKARSRIKYLENRTRELNQKREKGDFSKREPTRLNLDQNPDYVRAKAENEAAKAKYNKALTENRLAQRTKYEKIRDAARDTLGASRSVLASADFSAVGRQGVFFALPGVVLNPIQTSRQLKRMFQSQFSEGRFQQNEAALRSRDNADLYESSDLYLADIDHKPTAREEQFKSELAEKVPGIGRIVRGSSRGFNSFMNEVRADAMDSFINWSGGRDKVNPETAKYLAAAINDLTGRGNVTNRAAVGAMEWLARYLFSPRLWASRFNTVLLKPIWRDAFNKNISPRARAVVLGQYVKFLAAVAALKGLASLWGGQTKEDPRKGNLGEIRFGPKVYDVSGGIGGMLTFLTRLASGKTADKKGKLVNLTWEDGKRPERELGNLIFNHLRTKMAPIPGAIYDIRYGQHIGGGKVTPTSILQNTSIPLPVSDTLGFFRRDNPASALIDTALNISGFSVRDNRDRD